MAHKTYKVMIGGIEHQLRMDPDHAKQQYPNAVEVKDTKSVSEGSDVTKAASKPKNKSATAETKDSGE